MDHKVNIHIFQENEDPEKWLSKYSTWANTYQMSDQEKIENLPQYCEKSVQDWILGLPDHQKQSFSVIQRLFTARFAINQIQCNLTDFETTFQQSDETALQYIKKMIIMAHRLNLCEEELYNTVYFGLNTAIIMSPKMKYPSCVGDIVDRIEENPELNNVMPESATYTAYTIQGDTVEIPQAELVHSQDSSCKTCLQGQELQNADATNSVQGQVSETFHKHYSQSTNVQNGVTLNVQYKKGVCKLKVQYNRTHNWQYMYSASRDRQCYRCKPWYNHHDHWQFPSFSKHSKFKVFLYFISEVMHLQGV